MSFLDNLSLSELSIYDKRDVELDELIEKFPIPNNNFINGIPLQYLNDIISDGETINLSYTYYDGKLCDICYEYFLITRKIPEGIRNIDVINELIKVNFIPKRYCIISSFIKIDELNFDINYYAV